MTARRAARGPRQRVPTITTPAGELPAAARLGPCVEVWGPAGEVPSGARQTGLRSLDEPVSAAEHFFAAAQARYWAVMMAIDPSALNPNVHRVPPDAWSVDGRSKSARRLRSVVRDGRIDPVANLGEVGYSLNDVPRLRAQAQALLAQVPAPVAERAAEYRREEMLDAVTDE